MAGFLFIRRPVCSLWLIYEVLFVVAATLVLVFGHL